jgi:hypothetical protein
MKCWICGNEAQTGEHLIKASDMRAIFGPSASNQAPLRAHSDPEESPCEGNKRRRIQIDSDAVRAM